MNDLRARVKQQGFHFLLGILSTKSNPNGTNNILHAVGYKAYPTNDDIAELIKELATDEEFGLTDLIFDKDYSIIDITDEMIDELT